MSRLESGFLQPKTDWCDVNELVYDVVNQLHDNLQGKKIHIKIAETIPLVKLDYGLLEQILLNLLHNAAIYMPENGIITVHAMISKENKLLMAVEDNGPGFPENEISHVFDKFYRLEDTTDISGSGIGLSICKSVVKLHNGNIKAVPRNNGISIEINLPVMKRAKIL